MHDSCAEAFLDGSHVVLKRRLRPLTLRHAFLLTVGENAFFTNEEETIGDLYQLVEICSLENPDESLAAPSAKSALRRWWWEWTTRKSDWGVELEAARDYLEDFASHPDTWSKPGAGNKAKVNWIISSVAGLMSRLGMRKWEAWKTSPGEAAWLIAASYDSDPGTELSIVSEEEEKIIAKMKEDEAA